jgi:hypothetical protein
MGQRHTDGLVVGSAQHGKVLLTEQRQQPCGACGALPEREKIFEFHQGGTTCLKGGGELYCIVLCLDLQAVPDAVGERGGCCAEHHGQHRVREGCVGHCREDRGLRGLQGFQGSGAQVKGQALCEQVPGGCLVALRQGAGERCGCGLDRCIEVNVDGERASCGGGYGNSLTGTAGERVVPMLLNNLDNTASGHYYRKARCTVTSGVAPRKWHGPTKSRAVKSG